MICTFSHFGTVFQYTMETLQMQTVIDNATRIVSSQPRFSTSYPRIPDPANQIKSLKISEFKSWSVCFGIICALTGLLMYLQVGITMESVTVGLFFFALAGMLVSIYKLVNVFREPATLQTKTQLELN